MERLKLKDHRRYPRKDTQWEGIIKYRDHTIAITTIDISVQGMMVESKFKVRLNQRIFIMLDCKYNDKKMIIYAKARVKQIEIVHYKFRLILIFDEISPKSRGFISSFLESSY